MSGPLKIAVTPANLAGSDLVDIDEQRREALVYVPGGLVVLPLTDLAATHITTQRNLPKPYAPVKQDKPTTIAHTVQKMFTMKPLLRGTNNNEFSLTRLNKNKVDANAIPVGLIVRGKKQYLPFSLKNRQLKGAGRKVVSLGFVNNTTGYVITRTMFLAFEILREQKTVKDIECGTHYISISFTCPLEYAVGATYTESGSITSPSLQTGAAILSICERDKNDIYLTTIIVNSPSMYSQAFTNTCFIAKRSHVPVAIERYTHTTNIEAKRESLLGMKTPKFKLANKTQTLLELGLIKKDRKLRPQSKKVKINNSKFYKCKWLAYTSVAFCYGHPVLVIYGLDARISYGDGLLTKDKSYEEKAKQSGTIYILNPLVSHSGEMAVLFKIPTFKSSTIVSLYFIDGLLVILDRVTGDYNMVDVASAIRTLLMEDPFILGDKVCEAEIQSIPRRPSKSKTTSTPLKPRTLDLLFDKPFNIMSMAIIPDSAFDNNLYSNASLKPKTPTIDAAPEKTSILDPFKIDKPIVNGFIEPNAIFNISNSFVILGATNVTDEKVVESGYIGFGLFDIDIKKLEEAAFDMEKVLQLSNKELIQRIKEDKAFSKKIEAYVGFVISRNSIYKRDLAGPLIELMIKLAECSVPGDDTEIDDMASYFKTLDKVKDLADETISIIFGKYCNRVKETLAVKVLSCAKKLIQILAQAERVPLMSLAHTYRNKDFFRESLLLLDRQLQDLYDSYTQKPVNIPITTILETCLMHFLNMSGNGTYQIKPNDVEEAEMDNGCKSPVGIYKKVLSPLQSTSAINASVDCNVSATPNIQSPQIPTSFPGSPHFVAVLSPMRQEITLTTTTRRSNLDGQNWRVKSNIIEYIIDQQLVNLKQTTTLVSHFTSPVFSTVTITQADLLNAIMRLMSDDKSDYIWAETSVIQKLIKNNIDLTIQLTSQLTEYILSNKNYASSFGAMQLLMSGVFPNSYEIGLKLFMYGVMVGEPFSSAGMAMLEKSTKSGATRAVESMNIRRTQKEDLGSLLTLSPTKELIREKKLSNGLSASSGFVLSVVNNVIIKDPLLALKLAGSEKRRIDVKDWLTYADKAHDWRVFVRVFEAVVSRKLLHVLDQKNFISRRAFDIEEMYRMRRGSTLSTHSHSQLSSFKDVTEGPLSEMTYSPSSKNLLVVVASNSQPVLPRAKLKKKNSSTTQENSTLNSLAIYSMSGASSNHLPQELSPFICLYAQWKFPFIADRDIQTLTENIYELGPNQDCFTGLNVNEIKAAMLEALMSVNSRFML